MNYCCETKTEHEIVENHEKCVDGQSSSRSSHPQKSEAAKRPEPAASAPVAAGNANRKQHSASLRLHLRGWALILAIAVVAAPWVLLAGIFTVSAWRTTPQHTNHYNAHITSEKTFRCKPGPWGELEFIRILLELPDDYIPADFGSQKNVRWLFKGYSKESLTELFRSAGLTESQFQEITNPSNWEVTAEGITVVPSKSFILGMTPSARATVYTALSKFPENPWQHEPFRFRADALDEWFSDSGLSEETVSLIKSLLYQRDTAVMFSDCETVLPMLEPSNEKFKLLKKLLRRPALVVKLWIRPETDIEQLISYWGKGGQEKKIRPFLMSLPKVPGGFKIDISHLLPHFARARLNTFPLPFLNPSPVNRDCHWTSMNFFNDKPNDDFAATANVMKTLGSDYYPVPGAPQFGDVVLLVKQDGKAIHSCVYVADDIVFTKNGPSFAMPWVLEELSDVKAYYASDAPLRLLVYRHKKN